MTAGKALALGKYFVAILGVGALGGGFAIAFRAALKAALQLAFHEPDILSSFQALPDRVAHRRPRHRRAASRACWG